MQAKSRFVLRNTDLVFLIEFCYDKTRIEFFNKIPGYLHYVTRHLKFIFH
ncbi:MAG: hypothetical protein JWR61_1007 [Ferruginibacter sp.]|nr:hypothetical protein [Ferruginibacter sp.]